MTGIVVIGRNEGERLRECLESACSREGKFHKVVYVDSGSIDGSVFLAKAFEIEVLELNRDRPFSAARSRNEGTARLKEISPDAVYVQFVDGDCTLVAGWLMAARTYLQAHVDCAAVCGRLRERHPGKSLFNRLCDMEWNTPAGDVVACGGIAMYRLRALEAVGGFDPTVVAGEEPELCVRLRRAGWRIHKLEDDMAWHDAAMMRFGQWWKRCVRAGYAYALGAHMHGRSPERHWVKEVRSNWFWGLGLPVVILVLSWPTFAASLLLAALYGLLGVRIYRRMRVRGFCRADARLYALFCTLGKFPQAQGQAQLALQKARGINPGLIEYKNAK